MTVKVELFTADACSRCAQAKTALREVIDELGTEHFDLRLVDVVAHLDHAVEVGVLATPALAVNGQLASVSIPGKRRLRKLLLHQIASQRDAD